MSLEATTVESKAGLRADCLAMTMVEWKAASRVFHLEQLMAAKTVGHSVAKLAAP